VRSVAFTPQAEFDLVEIWQYYIEIKSSVSAARKVRSAILQAVDELSLMPGKGHYRAEIKDPALRCWSVYSYVIIYQYDQTTMTVVKILHHARDFRRHFP